MPKLLIIKKLLFMIHTRDHGFPHITVYYGNPKSHQAMAKIRIDIVEVIENKNFSNKDLKFILEITSLYYLDWLEEWNEIHEK